MRFTWLGTVLVLLGCGQCNDAESFQRLCEVYERYDGRPVSRENEVALLLEVKRELPYLYHAYYSDMLILDGSNQYRIVQGIAKEKGLPNWECEAFERRYRTAPKPKDVVYSDEPMQIISPPAP